MRSTLRARGDQTCWRTSKLLHFPHQAMFDHLRLFSLLGIQGVLELGGGFLLLIGLFSRPVAFLLCGDMAVAYFIAHFPHSWLPILNGGGLAVLFCFAFLYLWTAGPGPWSIDAWIRRGGSASVTAVPPGSVPAERHS